MRASIAVLLGLVPRLVFADCPPKQTPASCALHDEGVAAFTAGKYDEAATKFRAAIAAGATARSYLGYSQAVEGQGKIALAYETMLVAQKLSNEEMAGAGAKDPEIVGRAERIKYKLAELGAKIAYVWLRLPEGVPAQRVVAVYREGEGDLASPIGRWIVVAPEKQVLFATLDDGTRLQLTAQVASGSQGTLVIPVPAVAAQPAVTTPPVQQRPFVPAPMPGQDPYMPGAPPAAKSSPGPASTVFAIDAAFILRDGAGLGPGIGFGALFERKASTRLAVTGRLVAAFHPSQSSVSTLDTTSASATEWLFMAGARTRSKLPLYASVELGAAVLSGETTSDVTGSSEFSETYPAVLLGGGVRLGKVHFELCMLSVGNTGDVDLPTRFFATFGVDLVRR